MKPWNFSKFEALVQVEVNAVDESKPRASKQSVLTKRSSKNINRLLYTIASNTHVAGNSNQSLEDLWE